jgi:hypothetical protein
LPSKSWGRAIRAAIVTNWPIKLTALVLSAVLWAAVAAEEPTTQIVPVNLAIQPPPGRTLRGPVPAVQAIYVGATRELIKLYSSPPTIRKVIPDTLSGNEYTINLSPEDLASSRTANVRPEDVQPRTITVTLDELARRTIRVTPRVTIVPDSGYSVQGGIAVVPSSVMVYGPESAIRSLESISTVPIELSGITAPIRRAVRLDTTGLRGARLNPEEVEVSADVAFMSERVLMGVPVTIQSEHAGALAADPPAVIVTVRGPNGRLVRLTRDSVTVIATATGGERPEIVHLQVIPPDGLTGTATPDSALVARRIRG